MYNTYWRCNPSGDWYEHDTDWNEQDAMEQEIIYYEQEIMNVSWEEEEEQEAAAYILAEKEHEGTLTDEQKARIERNRKEALVKRARFLEQESAAAPKLSKPPALETLDDLMARQKEVCLPLPPPPAVSQALVRLLAESFTCACSAVVLADARPAALLAPASDAVVFFFVG